MRKVEIRVYLKVIPTCNNVTYRVCHQREYFLKLLDVIAVTWCFNLNFCRINWISLEVVLDLQYAKATFAYCTRLKL